MVIVTLNPPFLPMFSRASRSPAVTKSSTLYYPFFLAYATGVLEDEGFDVYMIDAPAAGFDKDETIKIISEIKPDLVVCETSTPSIENDMEIVAEIKNAGTPFVVAVGTHVSALPEEVLRNHSFLDAVARREYEYTIKDLSNVLSINGREADLDNIEGISFQKNGVIKHNRDRELIENLDELPFVSRVYRKHLRSHIDSYFYGANLHPIVTILSGRGCPHECRFCVYPQTMMGNRYRLRSVNNVVDELAFIKSELPEVCEVFIEDDTLTANVKRARAISQEIIRRKLKVRWSINSRADTDLETMKIMQKAGCRLLCVGFESGSQKILDVLGKNINREKYMKFRKDAALAKLLVHGCFMYGNEGETHDTMRETLELAKKLDCNTAQFYPIMVYPGTKAYDEYKKRGYITAQRYSDWLTPEGLHNCVVSFPNISKAEFVEFCDKSRREFYLRPKYIFTKILEAIAMPNERKRICRSSYSLIKALYLLSLKKRKNRKLFGSK